jgi:hypothetical protein
MTSVLFLNSNCGGWNRTSGLLIQSQASLPAATAPQRRFVEEHSKSVEVRGEGFEPSLPASKTGGLPLADPRECPAGVEPAWPAWKAGTFAARPRAHLVSTVFSSCGGRNRTCVPAVNSRLPVPARAPPHQHVVGIEQSARPDLNRRSPGSGPGGFPDFPTRRSTSTQRESNPHFRPGKAAGCRYNMGALES